MANRIKRWNGSSWIVVDDGDVIPLSEIDIDGGTDIGGALNDADLIIVDDGAGGTNRKSALSRVATWLFAKFSSDVTANSTGTMTIANDAVTNAKAANMATRTMKGRTTAGTGDPEDLTMAQVVAMLVGLIANTQLSTAAGQPGAVMSASTWTPAITGGTTNPTYGTGASRTGQYIQIGKMVFCRGNITMGTTSFNKGSGTYEFSLPVTPQTTGYPTALTLGHLRISAMTSSHIAVFSGPLIITAANGAQFRYPAAYPNGATTTVGSDAPVAVIASQRFEYFIAYEAA